MTTWRGTAPRASTQGHRKDAIHNTTSAALHFHATLERERSLLLEDSQVVCGRAAASSCTPGVSNAQLRIQKPLQRFTHLRSNVRGGSRGVRDGSRGVHGSAPGRPHFPARPAPSAAPRPAPGRGAWPARPGAPAAAAAAPSPAVPTLAPPRPASAARAGGPAGQLPPTAVLAPACMGARQRAGVTQQLGLQATRGCGRPWPHWGAQLHAQRTPYEADAN